MSTTTRSNRRLSARHACRLSVRYRSENDWRPATAMDLSMRGCRLRLGEDLGRGIEVRVVFERLVTDRTPSLEVAAVGSVIWSRREGLSHQVGIRFDDAPDELGEILSALG